MATPYAYVHLVEVDSTQDEARRRYDDQPLLVVADRQSHGRGREGRHWDQAPRSLAASVAVSPDWPGPTWPRLTLVAGLAALDALPEPLGLRWPNDLDRAGRKAGGILVEAADGLVVIGLGANLWWPDPPGDRVGLYHHDPGPEAAPALAASWAGSLLERMSAGPDRWGREEALRHSVTVGQRVSTGDGTEALAVDIDHDGALVVEADGHRWPIRSGRVRVADGPGGGQ